MDSADILNHTVNNGAKLATKLNIFVIFIDLASVFYVLALILGLFDILQVANLGSEFSMFQQKTWEGLSQISGSSWHKSYVRCLN